MTSEETDSAEFKVLTERLESLNELNGLFSRQKPDGLEYVNAQIAAVVGRLEELKATSAVLEYDKRLSKQLSTHALRSQDSDLLNRITNLLTAMKTEGAAP